MLVSDRTQFNRFRRSVVRATALLLIFAVIAACCFALSACDKNKKAGDAEKERNEAVTAFGNAYLSALNPEWSLSLSDEALLTRKDAGDYLVAANSVRAVCDVLRGSPLQTAKIKYAATFVSSEEGKALVASVKDNWKNVFTLMNGAGLTSTDAQYLAYNGLLAVIANDTAVYADAADKLNSLLKNVTDGEVRTTMTKALTEARNTVSCLNAAQPSANEVANAVKAAKNAIEALTAFVYDTAVVYGGGEDSASSFLDGIVSGALEGASSADAFAYLDAALGKVRDLSAKLTASAADALKTAMKLLDDRYGGFDSSAGGDSPMSVFSSVYWASDVLLPLCDYALRAGNVVYEKDESGAYRFAQKVLDYAKTRSDADSSAEAANRTILTAELAVSLYDSFASDSSGTAMSKVTEIFRSYEDETDPESLVALYFLYFFRMQDENPAAPDGDYKTAQLALLAVFNMQRAESMRTRYKITGTADAAMSGVMSSLANYLGLSYADYADVNVLSDYFYSLLTEGGVLPNGKSVQSVHDKLAEDFAATKNLIINDICDKFLAFESDGHVDTLRELAGSRILTANDSEDVTRVLDSAATLPYWSRVLFGLVK